MGNIFKYIDDFMRILQLMDRIYAHKKVRDREKIV